MSGNPTAGIILLLMAAGLIAIGVTGKGKAIINILLNREAYAPADTSQLEEGPKQSGGYEKPSDAPMQAGFAGEKPAKVVKQAL